MRRYRVVILSMIAGVLLLGAFDWLAASLDFQLVLFCNPKNAQAANAENCTAYHLLLSTFFGDFIALINRMANVINAASAFAIGVFTYFLMRISQRQSDDGRALHRVHIAVVPGEIREYLLNDDQMACDVVILNAGSLMATKVKWFIAAELADDSAKESFEYGEQVGNISLAPRAEMQKGTTNRHLRRTEFLKHREKAMNGKGPDGNRFWLFVYGRVTYHDGFRDGRQTDFCFRYSMARSTDKPARISEVDARYHEHGNCTDEG